MIKVMKNEEFSVKKQQREKGDSFVIPNLSTVNALVTEAARDRVFDQKHHWWTHQEMRLDT